MKEQREILRSLNINKSWTLFLDRDGVINRKIEGDYVRTWEQFEFLPGVVEALRVLTNIFGKTFIVTNQRGIGRGLMTEQNLEHIHDKMIRYLESQKVKIDRIYYCPHDDEKATCSCRKPNIGMALEAKKDFPEIDFQKSIMVGDSESDVIFGKSLNMITVYFSNQTNSMSTTEIITDLVFKDLLEFSITLKEAIAF
jgi:D-glycero-D-manno-heptose 1,7-bisphosphate phosphatase